MYTYIPKLHATIVNEIMFVYGWLPTGLIREVDMLSDAFVWYFVFDSMSGKWVAGGRVVVAIFAIVLLIVD